MQYIVMLFLVFSKAEAGVGTLLAVETVGELVRVDNLREQKKKWVAGCAYESSKGQFPHYCLKVLQAYLKEPSEVLLLRTLYKKVGRLCLKTYETIDDLDRVQDLLDHHFLPLSCRKKLEERKGDLRYSLTE